MGLQTSLEFISHIKNLEDARDLVFMRLKEKYNEKIKPFSNIIFQVMNANDCDVFAAVEKIKNEMLIYKTPGAQLFFSCALIDIIEEKHYAEFKR